MLQPASKRNIMLHGFLQRSSLRGSWLVIVSFRVFMVSNSEDVVLSMFIAVIVSNFMTNLTRLAREYWGHEDEKRKEQVRAFIEKAVPTLAKAEIRRYEPSFP